MSYSHIYLSHIEPHLPHGHIQSTVQLNVVVLGLGVFLFEEEAQPSFPLAPSTVRTPILSVQHHLPIVVQLVPFQAAAGPGRGSHTGDAVLSVGHGVQLG